MIAPTEHPNERQRLRELNEFKILDSLPESDYDGLTAIAAHICGTPISLISLVDDHRQWFKSHHGLDAQETPKEHAFCAHAITSDDEVFEVLDAYQDHRFHDNPLVTGEPNVVFYAGVPLKTSNGLPLGTLCVIDHKPNKLDEFQREALMQLASQVMRLMELRQKDAELQSQINRLTQKNAELERFATIAAHDLRSPLNNISGIVDLLQNTHDERRNELLGYLSQSAQRLRQLVDGILEHSRAGQLTEGDKSEVTPGQLLNTLIQTIRPEPNVRLFCESAIPKITVHAFALNRILLNLVTNAIKYCDKEKVEVAVRISDKATHYEIAVEDNGAGIPESEHEAIFELFSTHHETD